MAKLHRRLLRLPHRVLTAALAGALLVPAVGFAQEAPPDASPAPSAATPAIEASGVGRTGRELDTLLAGTQMLETLKEQRLPDLAALAPRMRIAVIDPASLLKDSSGLPMLDISSSST
jgi:hypothetical protein